MKGLCHWTVWSAPVPQDENENRGRSLGPASVSVFVRVLPRVLPAGGLNSEVILCHRQAGR